jgi:hypothetical protein
MVLGAGCIGKLNKDIVNFSSIQNTEELNFIIEKMLLGMDATLCTSFSAAENPEYVAYVERLVNDTSKKVYANVDRCADDWKQRASIAANDRRIRACTRSGVVEKTRKKTHGNSMAFFSTNNWLFFAIVTIHVSFMYGVYNRISEFWGSEDVSRILCALFTFVHILVIIILLHREEDNNDKEDKEDVLPGNNAILGIVVNVIVFIHILLSEPLNYDLAAEKNGTDKEKFATDIQYVVMSIVRCATTVVYVGWVTETINEEEPLIITGNFLLMILAMTSSHCIRCCILTEYADARPLKYHTHHADVGKLLLLSSFFLNIGGMVAFHDLVSTEIVGTAMVVIESFIQIFIFGCDYLILIRRNLIRRNMTELLSVMRYIFTVCLFLLNHIMQTFFIGVYSIIIWSHHKDTMKS